MARYKLLAGQHVADDPDWEPSKQEAQEAEAAGRVPRNPGKTYKAGDTIESETDLVARFGPQKFELIGGEAAKAGDEIARLKARVAELEREKQAAQTGEQFRTPGDPTPENLLGSPAKFPGGQVSTGFQGGPPSGESKAAVPPSGDEDLESMTVAELRDLADEEEIDLRGATRKDDIIAAIRAGRQG